MCVVPYEAGTDDCAVGVDDPLPRFRGRDVVVGVVGDLVARHLAFVGPQDGGPAQWAGVRSRPQAGFADAAVKRGDLYLAVETELVA